MILHKVKIQIKKILFCGNRFFCNCCNSHVRKFLPGGSDVKVINELNIVGMGRRQYDVCPVCNSSDKQRIIKHYFNNSKFLNKKNKIKILHVAPEPCFTDYFDTFASEYHPTDLTPERYTYYYPDIKKADLTSLEFPNDYFDLVLCNHVLEHIVDDTKAVSEVYRVLKNNGIAILQVPYSKKIANNIENNKLTSRSERLQAFGQDDHVRVYALQQYHQLLKNTGFKLSVFKPDYSNSFIKNKLSLYESEELTICYKSSHLG